MLIFKKVEKTEIKELASLANAIWHEYWTCILSAEQIDYMVENFQSEKAIINQIENENYTYYFIETYPLSLTLSPGERIVNISSPRERMQLCEQSELQMQERGQVAGYFGVSDKKDYLFLSKLYIKKEFRHQGIGAKAFDEIKKIANGKPIRLTVNKYNTNTINAYKKWGFKTIDAVVTDIGNGFVMDDYIMENITH